MSSKHDVVIRAARSADIPEIQRVGIDADQRFLEIGFPDLSNGSTIATDVAEAALADGRLHVAELNGEIAGWIYIGRVDGEPYLGEVSVARRFGRRGIGTALLMRAVDDARARGDTSILLNTQTNVPWNRPWYERHGFVEIPASAWTPALQRIADAQSKAGLDWATRVHMRRVL